MVVSFFGHNLARTFRIAAIRISGYHLAQAVILYSMTYVAPTHPVCQNELPAAKNITLRVGPLLAPLAVTFAFTELGSAKPPG